MDEEKMNEEIEELEDDNTIIELEDEDGGKIQFEFLDLIEYENEEYVILLPLEEEGTDGDEVVILKLQETSDTEEVYLGVDDEKILQAVFTIFKERNKDEFDFVD